MNFTHASFRRKQWLPLPVIFVCAIIAIFTVFIHPSVTHADAAPGGNIANPVVRAVDMAKPAVVRIITTIGGRLTVHFPTASNPSATFPQNGGTYSLAASGSGAFISAHGDILTADHVIKPPHDGSLDPYLQALAAQDVADYINQNFQTTSGTPYTQNDALQELQSGYLRSEANYDTPTSEVYLSTDYLGVASAFDLKSMPDGTHAPVDQVKQDSAFNEKDVAIIHVALNNTPFIQLGDSSNVAQQDELTVIGFPGNGDLSNKKNPNSYLTSSVNKIYVSAIKQTDAGAPVIEVGGNIEHGDSGGPALDSKGNIVGIVSFGLAESQPQGTTFLQASNSAEDLIHSIALDTKPGTLQRSWQQAFADYSTNSPNHWHKAQQELQQISDKYPQFMAVNTFLNYAKTQASHEQTPPPATSTPNPAIIVAGVIIVLILIALLLTLLIIRSRRKKGSADTTAAPFPMGAYSPAVTSSSDPYSPSALTTPNNGPSAFPPAQASGPYWSAAQPSQPIPPVQKYEAAWGGAPSRTSTQEYGPDQNIARPIQPAAVLPGNMQPQNPAQPAASVAGYAQTQNPAQLSQTMPPAPGYRPAQSPQVSQPVPAVQEYRPAPVPQPLPPNQEYRTVQATQPGQQTQNPGAQSGQQPAWTPGRPMQEYGPARTPAQPAQEYRPQQTTSTPATNESARLDDTQGFRAIKVDRSAPPAPPTNTSDVRNGPVAHSGDDPTVRSRQAEPVTDAPTQISSKDSWPPR